MTLNLLIFLSSLFINLFLVFLILFRNKEDNKNKINIWFAAGIFLLILWSLFNFLADISANTKDALFWTRATFPASMITLWFFLYFSYIFPKRISKKNIFNIIMLILVVVFSYLSMTDRIINVVYLSKGFGISGVEVGNWYYLNVLLYFGIFAGILINYIKKYFYFKSFYKNQIKFILIGWGLMIGGGLLTNLILPLIYSNAKWSKFGPLMSVFMVSFTVYAIVKHNFLNIKEIIQRMVIYSTTYSVLVGVYLAILFLINLWFQSFSDVSSLIVGVFTVLVGTFSIPKIENFFIKITDKIFFKGKYDFSLAINSLSRVLNKNIKIEKLATEFLSQLESIIKTKDPKLLILSGKKVYSKKSMKKVKNIPLDIFKLIEKKKLKIIFRQDMRILEIEGQIDKNFIEKIENWFKSSGVEIFVPVFIDRKVAAVLMVGEKKSGDIFYSEDELLLRTLSHQMSVALERSRLYEEVRDYSKSLEKKAEERAKEITELQEEQKQMMLEVSHELQTPLTVMKGELEFLRQDIPGNKKLDILEKSVDKVSKNIYNILSYAKITNFKDNKAKLIKISLSEVLLEVAEYLEVIVAEKNIKLKHNIKDNVFIEGNKELIEKLIANLVSNATKYMKKGKNKKIDINLEGGGGKASLSVSDNGIGISKEDLPMLFRKFFRSKDYHKNYVKGIGLGLAICKKIVDIHNGNLSVESELGKGTKFTINFKTIN